MYFVYFLPLWVSVSPTPPLDPPMGALSQEGGEGGGEGWEESKRDINQVTQSIARCKTGSACTCTVQYMAVWFTFM
jgi:hypothetical protein